MTGPERADLKLALDFLAEWREEDRIWKAKADTRLQKLEQRNIAADAVSADRNERRRRATDDLRWRNGLIVGLLGSIGLGVLNFLATVHHP